MAGYVKGWFLVPGVGGSASHVVGSCPWDLMPEPCWQPLALTQGSVVGRTF